MLKHFPGQLFLSFLLSLGLFASSPVQAQDWSEWRRWAEGIFFSEEQERQNDEEDAYGGVYVLLALLIGAGYFAEGGCE